MFKHLWNFKKFLRSLKGKKKKVPKTPLTHQVTIKKHLVEVGASSLVKELPPKLMKIRRTAESLYFSDEKVAKKFSSLISKDIVQGSSSFVAEINPGLGLLTEGLLQTKIPKIHLYEPTPSFILPNSRLQSLVYKNPLRLELRKANLLKMWDAAFMDLKDGGNRFQEMMKGIEKRKWNDDPYMKIVGAIANNKLIKHLTMSVIFQNSFVECGRVILFLAMPPSDWLKLTADENSSYYKPRSVLFQALFDFEKLGELPRKAFLPWRTPLVDNGMQKVLQKLKKLDEESLYVVRIEPKANLFDKKLKQQGLLGFYFFVRHHLQIKHTRIIPSLEKWIPNCGPRLIAKDFNIYSEFQELSPNKLLELYIEFSSWPEYETSQFVDFTATFINRIEEAVATFDGKYIK
ncbi:dimethyladenosine transferase 2, mitochondrial isoform X2 [Belonocnema kinseyi]|uniref:dimethyladenosine transferase 2, mitochondrial isoform X2 n=1 Tax=Belonocnema kinseyi TaxID=2817044 RepID=UPI00143CE62C|nr:dimethyladenosine transferase 2, mitochondrial isoform X2 [Belonocnema kinseyi]